MSSPPDYRRILSVSPSRWLLAQLCCRRSGNEKRCDLSTKERRPSARRVSHAGCRWKLGGSEAPHGHDPSVAKETQKCLQERCACSQFGMGRHPIAQHAEARSERMPGKHVPQDKFVAPHSVAEQRAPDNACGRFGKTTWRSLKPACSPRLDRRENIVRRNLRISAQEDPFGSHGDAGEMPAAVAERLSDECQLSFANAL